MRDKPFNIAKNPKCEGSKRELASMVYKFFDNILSGSAVKNKNISNKELTEDLQKVIIERFKNRRIHSPFRDNICGADLAN